MFVISGFHKACGSSNKKKVYLEVIARSICSFRRAFPAEHALSQTVPKICGSLITTWQYESRS